MKNILLFENFNKNNINYENIEESKYFFNFILDNYDRLDYYNKFEKITKDLFREHGLLKRSTNKYESVKFDSKHTVKFDNINQTNKRTKIILFSASITSDYLKKHEVIEISFYLDFEYFYPSVYCYLDNSNLKSYSKINNYDAPKTDSECRECLEQIINDCRKYVTNYISKHELIAVHNKNIFLDNENV